MSAKEQDLKKMKRLARLWVRGKASKEQMLEHMRLSRKIYAGNKPQTNFVREIKSTLSGIPVEEIPS